MTSHLYDLPVVFVYREKIADLYLTWSGDRACFETPNVWYLIH